MIDVSHQIAPRGTRGMGVLGMGVLGALASRQMRTHPPEVGLQGFNCSNKALGEVQHGSQGQEAFHLRPRVPVFDPAQRGQRGQRDIGPLPQRAPGSCPGLGLG